MQNDCEHASLSENHGLQALASNDLKVYSVGISTGGRAEIRMAKKNPQRCIIATTLDAEGAAFARDQIDKQGLSGQIDVRIEDVSKALPHEDDYFDFIYARLVLHYLPKKDLKKALQELHRVLKPDGKLFVVVRSDQCPETRSSNSTYDSESGMTTYHSEGKSYSRYFHSEKSITAHLVSSGFAVNHVLTYPERLCSDFQRMKPSQHVDTLIEILATRLSQGFRS